jgi:tetratricopeptide (TPR) repeat protein
MNVPSLSLAIAAAALTAGSVVNLRLAEARVSQPYDVSHVPSGAAVRVAALGHRTFLSDMYWLAAVQYIGEPDADVRGWEKLFPLVDLVTDLDPRHGYAYQTAGIVLSAAGRFDESNRILEKGIERGPPRWTYAFYLSFNHWFYLGDYEEGARWARVAAQTPGASPNISQLALSLSAKTGRPQDALALLEELRETVTDEETAKRLEHQMRLAVVERDAQALEAAAERFRAERGTPPAPLDALAWHGYVAAMPKDPFGGRYFLDPADGRVRSSANPFRFTLKEGPHASGFQYAPSEQALERMPQ